MRSVAFISVFLLGCSILSPKKTDSSGGTGGGSGTGPTAQVGKGWSEILVEAPTFKIGSPVEAQQPPCNASGYIKVEVDQDKPFHVVAKSPPAGNSCAYVEVVNGNGSAANTSASSTEICGETKTIDTKGQPGGTYIVVSEKYGCAGITVSLAINDGPAGAAPAPAPTGDAPAPQPESEGPKPEN